MRNIALGLRTNNGALPANRDRAVLESNCNTLQRKGPEPTLVELRPKEEPSEETGGPENQSSRPWWKFWG